MHKKGIALSLQAIVAIIFAVAVLSLGLLFITATFDRATTTLELPTPVLQPTATTPLILPETITAQAGTAVRFSLGFYNKAETREVLPVLQSCVPDDSFTLTALSQEVGRGQEQLFTVVLTIPGNVAAQQYICSLQAGEEARQFVVEVRT